MTYRFTNERGFTIVEIAIVLVIMGVVLAIAIRESMTSVDDARVQHTMTELEAIKTAIIGDPSVSPDGTQAGFGYVGDVGALPGSLTDLITNPGSYATWDGPYLQTRDGDVAAYLLDGWGAAYTLVGVTVNSNGGGSTISTSLATASADLTANTLIGTLRDAKGAAPGSSFADSITIRLSYPNGSGGVTAAVVAPLANGSFSFSGLPIGRHELTTVYLPLNDTTTSVVTILPGQDRSCEVIFPLDLF